jgi:hypothetical protein
MLGDLSAGRPLRAHPANHTVQAIVTIVKLGGIFSIADSPRPNQSDVDRIDLGEYASWLDAKHVVVNVYQCYGEFDSGTTRLPILGLLSMQAEWFAKHS